MALDSFELYIIIGGVAVVAGIVVAVWCCRRRQRRSPYSLLDKKTKRLEERKVSGPKFKDDQLWIGGQNIEKVKEARSQAKKLQKSDERYLVAVRYAGNYCKNLQHNRFIVDELPGIGYRPHKFFHVVNDDELGRLHNTPEMAILMTHYSVKAVPASNLTDIFFDFNNRKQRKALRNILRAIKSPYVLPTFDVEFGKTVDDMFVLRKVALDGSLRDLICNRANLSQPYNMKYGGGGKPLSVNQIRSFGRQILEGLSYFKSIGFPYYHLHAGNVIVYDDTNCVLSDYENAFMGFTIRNTINRKIRRIIKKDPTANFDVDVLAFGYLLFEMATGQECPTHEPPQLASRNYKLVQDIIERIFYSQTPCSVQDLIQSPFFGNVMGVRMSDVSEFNDLKNGDTPSHQLVREKLQSISNAFQEKYIPKPPEEKKKKKKSRRRKEKTKEKKKEAAGAGEEPPAAPPLPPAAGTTSGGVPPAAAVDTKEKSERKKKKKKKKKSEDIIPQEVQEDSDDDMFGTSTRTSRKKKFPHRGGGGGGGLFDDLDEKDNGSDGSDSEMFGASGSDGSGGGSDYFDIDSDIDVADLLGDIGGGSKKKKRPPPPPPDAVRSPNSG